MKIREFRDCTKKGITVMELPRPLIAVAPAMCIQKLAYVPRPIPPERIQLARKRVQERRRGQIERMPQDNVLLAMSTPPKPSGANKRKSGTLGAPVERKKRSSSAKKPKHE